jgi:hypothetical protein
MTDAATVLVEEKPKLRLIDMTRMMQEMDEDILDAEIDPQDLVEGLAHKIDSIGGLLDEWRAKAVALREREKVLADKRRRWERKVEQLEGYVQFAMERDGFDKLPGKEYAATIRRSESIELLKEPSALVRSQFPDLIRVKYEWEKRACKEALKDGRLSEEYAKITVNRSINIK